MAHQEKTISAKAKSPRIAGFTLIEMIITIGIFGMVMSMAYQILSQTMRAEQRITKNTRTGKIGQGILTQMRRDLQGLVWRSYGSSVFLGIDGGSGEDAADEIHFITTSPVPTPDEDLDLYAGEAASVGYVLKQGSEGLGILFRRVKYELHENPLDDGEYFEVYQHVQGLEIRYLGPEDEWLDEWDPTDELDALENQNLGTFLPYRDHDTAEEEALAEEAAESGDPTAILDDDEEEEEEIPLPLPRAVEIILYLAVKDEIGYYQDSEGERLIERVSTIVPLVTTDILRVEDPEAALEDDTTAGF